jgi:hypothetical protein
MVAPALLHVAAVSLMTFSCEVCSDPKSVTPELALIEQTAATLPLTSYVADGSAAKAGVAIMLTPISDMRVDFFTFHSFCFHAG